MAKCLGMQDESAKRNLPRPGGEVERNATAYGTGIGFASLRLSLKGHAGEDGR
jgi:hypothetical protein